MQEIDLTPSWGPYAVPHKVICMVVGMPHPGEITVGDLYHGRAPEGVSYYRFHNARLKPGEFVEFEGPVEATCTLVVEAVWDNPENAGIPPIE